MNNKFYEKMDEKIDTLIEKARLDRTRVYAIKMKQLKVRKMEYPSSVSFKKICDDNLSYENEYSIFEFKSYNFVSFNNTKWGTDIVLGEKDFIEVCETTFYYVDFTNCQFENIIFNGCHFVGCKFNNCSTANGKVIFQNCCLRTSETEYDGTESVKTQIRTEFFACITMQVDIRNSLADYLLFDKCSLIISNFVENEMPNTVFNNCGFFGVVIEDCKINKVKIKGTMNYKLKFNKTKNDGEVETDVYISKLSLNKYKNKVLKELEVRNKNSSAENLMGKEFIKEKYSEVAQLYYTISMFLKTSNFNDSYSREYSYLHNKYLMMVKEDFWDRFVLFLSWILFGFGERMGRFVFWSTGYIIIFSLIYMFTGITDSSGELIKYCIIGGQPVPLNEVANDFFQCMHFSVVTFSTVGYGNITPYGWSLLVSAIQVISGVALIALFTSVIVKKFLK
jgi:uncharacterized protein YjbI with pentapeptide repeats